MKRKVTRISHITIETFFNDFGKDLNLELLRDNMDLERKITEPATNRSGLAFSGFLEDFALERIQIIGNAEMAYLRTLDSETLAERTSAICDMGIPCFIISRDADVPSEFLDQVESGSVKGVEIEGREITWSTSNGNQFKTYSPETDMGPLVGDLRAADVGIEGVPPKRQSVMTQLLISSLI